MSDLERPVQTGGGNRRAVQLTMRRAGMESMADMCATESVWLCCAGTDAVMMNCCVPLSSER